jgi:hypothetical protein
MSTFFQIETRKQEALDLLDRGRYAEAALTLESAVEI